MLKEDIVITNAYRTAVGSLGKSLKNFRATTFSIKNEVYEKAPPGWVITDVEDIDWLGELFIEDISFSDI